MVIKFNGGNGAYLCDKCSKIVYTNANVPRDVLLGIIWRGHDECPLICDDCKNDNVPVV